MSQSKSSKTQGSPGSAGSQTISESLAKKEHPSPKNFEPHSPNDSPPPPLPSHAPMSVSAAAADASPSANAKPPNPKAEFETMVEFYLASNPGFEDKKRGISELEVRFGTSNKRDNKCRHIIPPISKIDYDNVIRQLYSAGFTTTDPEGFSILRIQNEYMETREGETRISNVRAEIMGLDLIQEYCRTNNLQKLIDLPSTANASADKIKFTQKTPPQVVGHRDEKKPLKFVEFGDFNFRVSYQLEKDYNIRSDVAKQILAKWTDSKKLFRYINRIRLSHPVLPIFADLSIVKGSSKIMTRQCKEIPIPQYTIQEAKVFSNEEHYEIELEIDNSRVGLGTAFEKPEPLLEAIRRCIRIVLGGLQGTNYPISYTERDQVLQTYLRMIHNPDNEHNSLKQNSPKHPGEQPPNPLQPRRVLPRDFIGPSSYTLQLENIQALTGETGENSTGSNVPNIRRNYTVTDKADGERKLLYIAPNGRIYMIDTNMNVIFTGTVTSDKELQDSLLDGEHIKYNKQGQFINLYAAFDVYFIKNKSTRELGFIPMDNEDEETKHRLPLLSNYIRLLKPVSILDDPKGNSDPSKNPVKAPQLSMAEMMSSYMTKGKAEMSKRHIKPTVADKHSCKFTIKCKQFYSSADVSIFNGCATILSNVNDGTYEYNTDGLIFTPSHTGVGSNRVGHAGPLYKSTWELSFKWKPPKFNTVDFLVSIKKDKTGKDEVHHIFQEGVNLAGMQNMLQYKTLILMCGFDERKHGYINPMLDMINDQLPNPSDIDNENSYQARPFQPTNPYDATASLCNVQLHDNGTSDLVMLTEEHEYMEEDMIVEFSYDPTKQMGWKWVPLRVRYDKTNELRSGLKNYGNAYHVANSNWHSIHNPVTEQMISTGKNIPEVIANDDDVYYNRSGQDTNTRPLRDFHNLFVKRALIMGVSNRGNTLIDYAVGKAGDLPKWIAGKLDFVFGVDVSKDNIENHIDGACARFLNFRKKYHKMPGALFVTGNSGLNIRSGKALFSEKDKQITKAIFGQGPKDKGELGEGVYKRYGVGEPGFNISSCQFALHYFFESERTMHSFLRNVAECTKIGGYFIGTCYDGQTVFNKLRNKKKGESITFMRGDKKIYEITKQYDQTGFPDDELSLGYVVDVYQESINKVFSEFLVNFKYLIRIMEDYGFALIGREEAYSMHIPGATGLFDELYRDMMDEIDRDRRRETEYGVAPDMTVEEKQISFLNRYFVFRKMRSVNAEKVGKLMMRKGDGDSDEDEKSKEEKGEKEKGEKEEKEKSVVKSVIRKLRGDKVKIVIGEASPSAAAELLKEPEKSSPSIVYGKSVIISRKKP